MRNVPLAAPINFTKRISSLDEQEGVWCIFQDRQQLILTSLDGKHLPTTPLTLKRSLYIGMLGDKHLFAGEVDNLDQVPDGWVWNHLHSLFGIINDEYFAIAGYAMQLMEWDRTHQYCGCCGHLTIIKENERCRECSSCGHLAFPKIAPVIIALIKKEDKILLARGPHFPEKFYSVLAGFVDPGETLEQCVAREVLEEVGLQVKNIRYFGSQPWPFSNSLMIGFTCEWQSGEIQIEPQELEDAAWFDKMSLPQLPPPLSLSRLMIDAYIRDC